MPTTAIEDKARRPRRLTMAMKRKRLRDRLWPEADELVWDRLRNQGFATIPRLLPLVLVLIKTLAGSKGDPTRVYLELWSRVHDEGLVLDADDADCAFASGYTGSRAVRSWRERIFQLKEMGFIEIEPRGGNELGYILILNPLRVAARLAHEKKVTREWWNAFIGRASEIGAVVPVHKDSKDRKGLKKPR